MKDRNVNHEPIQKEILDEFDTVRALVICHVCQGKGEFHYHGHGVAQCYNCKGEGKFETSVKRRIDER